MQPNPDILAITETWLSENKHLYDFTGYYSYHLTRKTRRQGGISIFVSNMIQSNEVEELSIVTENIEINS